MMWKIDVGERYMLAFGGDFSFERSALIGGGVVGLGLLEGDLGVVGADVVEVVIPALTNAAACTGGGVVGTGLMGLLDAGVEGEEDEEGGVEGVGVLKRARRLLLISSAERSCGCDGVPSSTFIGCGLPSSAICISFYDKTNVVFFKT